jgi:hypothetical protein
MVKVSPMEGADKLKRGITSHGTDYLAGVQKVTQNPAELAAAKAEQWFASLQDAYANGRFQRGLGRVTLADWKASVQNGGAARYTQSADRAATNYQRFATQFYPYLDSVQSQVSSMPKRNLAESIQRMVRNVELIHEFKNR